jgi:hypothetical protein
MLVNLAAFEMPATASAQKGAGDAPDLPRIDASSLIRHHWPQRIGKVFVDPLNLAIIDLLNRATLAPGELHDRLGGATPRQFLEKCQFLTELGWLAELDGGRPGGAHRGSKLRRFQATSPTTSQAAILRPLRASARRSEVARPFEEFSAAAVSALEAGTFNRRSDRHLTESQLRVDELGWMQVIEALSACKTALQKVEAAARRRRHGANAGEFIPVGVLVSGFEGPLREIRG